MTEWMNDFVMVSEMECGLNSDGDEQIVDQLMVSDCEESDKQADRSVIIESKSKKKVKR